MKTNVAEHYHRDIKRRLRLDPLFVALELARNKEWRSRNTVSIAENKKKYLLENAESIKVKKKERYVNRKKRNVSFDSDLTSFVFLEARRLAKSRQMLTGFRWSVDHVIPLVGHKVSGLHVWNNLQVIPLSENHRKYNSYEEAGN